jgi:hypothetical protein
MWISLMWISLLTFCTILHDEPGSLLPAQNRQQAAAVQKGNR